MTKEKRRKENKRAASCGFIRRFQAQSPREKVFCCLSLLLASDVEHQAFVVEPSTFSILKREQSATRCLVTRKGVVRAADQAKEQGFL